MDKYAVMKKNSAPSPKARRMTSGFMLLALCVALLAACANYTHVFRAFEAGSPAEVQKALDDVKGQDINVRDRDGVTPLMLAASENPHPESIKKMLAAGAKVNSLTLSRRSALSYAALRNLNPEITKVLLEAGAELENEDADGVTPLIASMRNPNLEVPRVLIAFGANVNHHSERGFTPLMVACRYARPEFVKLLLEAGSDVNAVNARGITALHFAAAESPYPEIIKMLLQAGANAHVIDMNGHTALSVASGRPGIKEALIKAGAR